MLSIIQPGKTQLTNCVSRKAIIVTAQRSFFSTFFSSNDGGNDVNESASKPKRTITGVFTKSDMIKMVAEEHDLSQAQSGRIINSIFDTMMEVRKYDLIAKSYIVF